MALYDLLPKIVGPLVPTEDADPKHQYKWRVAVALVLLFLTTMQGLHMLIACGYLASYGISGFAYAGDVQQVIATQARVEKRQIGRDLTDLEATYCRAKQVGKPTRALTDRIRGLQEEYQILFGRLWVRPACEELGE